MLLCNFARMAARNRLRHLRLGVDLCSGPRDRMFGTTGAWGQGAPMQRADFAEFVRHTDPGVSAVQTSEHLTQICTGEYERRPRLMHCNAPGGAVKRAGKMHIRPGTAAVHAAQQPSLVTWRTVAVSQKDDRGVVRSNNHGPGVLPWRVERLEMPGLTVVPARM